MLNKQELAKQSIYIEQEVLHETVGSQDQVLAAHGGFTQIKFSTNGDILVRPITLSPERIHELNNCLMLFFTGINRTASSIANSYVQAVDHKQQELRDISAMVDEGISILNSGANIGSFGKLLHEGWQAKRRLSNTISNSHIEDIYAGARSAGAIGGKLIGAGGGGFMLLFAYPQDHSRIRAKLSTLLHVPFEFEYSGSQIILFDQENDYSAAEKTRAAQALAPFKELSS